MDEFANTGTNAASVREIEASIEEMHDVSLPKELVAKYFPGIDLAILTLVSFFVTTQA